MYDSFTCAFEQLNSFFSVIQRPVPEQKELTNKWNEMGTDEPGNADMLKVTSHCVCVFVCVCVFMHCRMFTHRFGSHTEAPSSKIAP